MKHELYYSLVAVRDMLEKDLQLLESALGQLEPMVSLPARMQLWRINGILKFVKSEIDNYDSED